MAKLSKQDIKVHNTVMELIHSDKTLTQDEVYFILENYNEGATVANSELGAFFTPMGLCRDFSFDVPNIKNGKYVDLCAGIGKLSYFIIEDLKRHKLDFEYTMVEFSHTYFNIGKRLFPDVNWINENVFTAFQLEKQFDVAVSNPPFGNIKTGKDTPYLKYQKGNFELKLMELAGIIASYGAFIIPQASSSFSYSGKPYYMKDVNRKGLEFEKATGHKMLAGVGVDTKFYLDEWNGVSPLCEVVCIDYDNKWY